MALIFCLTLSLMFSDFNVVSGATVGLEKLEMPNDLENLDFPDLLKAAQISDAHSKLAADVFHRKYSQHRVIVSDYFSFPEESNELAELLKATGIKMADTDKFEQSSKEISYFLNGKPNVAADNNHITLYHYDGIVNTFKHFGHLMKQLKADTIPSTAPWQAELIGYLISAYSAESLVDVEFQGYPEKLWKSITKPLTNAENVEFKQTICDLNIPIIRFAQLFPAVRRLNLRTWTRHGLANFNYHMPHLEHLSLRRSSNSSTYLDIIRKNPQIKSISLKQPEPEFVQEMNTLLPQLETLNLSRVRIQTGSIQFENVTALKFGNADFTSPENLHFPRLQSLQIHYDSVRFTEYLAFLNEHCHLSQLHVKGNFKDDSQFQQLTAKLNDLVEVTLEHRFTIKKESIHSGISTIEQFLKSHDKVKKFNVINFKDGWNTELLERLKHGWNMNIIDNGMAFQRK